MALAEDVIAPSFAVERGTGRDIPSAVVRIEETRRSIVRPLFIASTAFYVLGLIVLAYFPDVAGFKIHRLDQCGLCARTCPVRDDVCGGVYLLAPGQPLHRSPSGRDLGGHHQGASAGSWAMIASAQGQWLTSIFFLLFIAVSLGLTFWSIRRSRSASGFYVAGRNLSGWQNRSCVVGRLYVGGIVPRHRGAGVAVRV